MSPASNIILISGDHIPMPSPIIYAAGRINQRTRNRFGITQNVIASHQASEFPAAHAHVIDCDHEGYRYRYAGPYTCGCDHSCSHRPASAFPDPETRGSSTHAMARPDCSDEGIPWTPDDIFLRSIDGVTKADVMFVWIDDYECHGTLVEIGVALNQKKPIYLAHHPDIQPHGELWFAFKAATSVSCFPDAHTAYSAFIKQVGSPASQGK